MLADTKIGKALLRVNKFPLTLLKDIENAPITTIRIATH